MVTFSYIADDMNRTAGQHNAQKIKSVQAWKKPKIMTAEIVEQPSRTRQTAQKNILNTLENAAQGHGDGFNSHLENAIAYAPASHPMQDNTQIISKNPSAQESFKFGDVIDMVNPLQHIPVVGMVYRGLTGDDLHPMAHIVGGALYGGPIGAVSGTVNAITQMQTGQDLGGHALEFAGLKTDIFAPNIAKPAPQNIMSRNITPDTTLALIDLSTPPDEIEPLRFSAMPPKAEI